MRLNTSGYSYCSQGMAVLKLEHSAVFMANGFRHCMLRSAAPLVYNVLLVTCCWPHLADNIETLLQPCLTSSNHNASFEHSPTVSHIAYHYDVSGPPNHLLLCLKPAWTD